MTRRLKRRRDASSSATRSQSFGELHWAFLLPAYGRKHACRGAFADRVKADCGFTLWAQGKQLAVSRWHMICSVKGCGARVVYRKEEDGAGIYLIAENPGHTHEVRQPPAPPLAVEPAAPTAPEPNPTHEPEPTNAKTQSRPEPSKPLPPTASESKKLSPETSDPSEEHEKGAQFDGRAADEVCVQRTDGETWNQGHDGGSSDLPAVF